MNTSQSTLIKNAKVHNGLGEVLEAIDIFLEDGKIAHLGKNLSQKADEVIDAAGNDVFPGFISALSSWGGLGPSMDANNLCESSDPVTPDMNVEYVFMIDSMTSSELYKFGITASCLAPDFSNMFGGLAAVYKTYGFRADRMLVKEEVAEVAALSDKVKLTHAGKPNMNTNMGMFHLFLKTLRDAQGYTKAMGYNSQKAVLSSIINGKLPLIIHIDSRCKFELLKTELQAFPKLRYVINGIFDINKIEDTEISEGKQAVILNSVADSSFKNEELVKFDDINNMVQEGAKIALSPNFIPAEMNHKEALLWNANVFYKNGVSCENVLKMITSIPASILDVNDRIGSIEVGKDADLTIWNGNPIASFTAKLQQVFINGEELSGKEKVRVCW